MISTFAGDVAIPTPIPAAKASLGTTTGTAVDAAGNLYFTSLHAVYKVDTKGIVTHIAGTGHVGYSGDGGLATSAQLNSPVGLAVGSNGDIYVADSGNSRIRKISPTGVITPFAGQNLAGEVGDGGPVANAQVLVPFALAIDAGGNLYFSEILTNRIRKISAAGIITTLAGTDQGFSGDGGPAIKAQLYQPEGVAVDGAGNVYFADYQNNRVRKISASGIITTVAGDGGCCSDADGGLATKSNVYTPTGVAIDGAGSLYIAQNTRVRKVLPDGTITSVAGSGIFGNSGDGGLATQAQMNLLSIGLTFDGAGTFYVADQLSYNIRKVSKSGIITTAVGNGLYNLSGDGGPAAAAQVGLPTSMAMDNAGNLYISDDFNPVVRKISPAGIVSTFAGNGLKGFSGDGGPAPQARLSGGAVAADGAGNVYIADKMNGRIRKVASDGTITTVAGTGAYGFSGDGGPAIAANLSWPHGVAADRNGNLYIAEDFRIRKVSTSGIISTIVGDGTAGLSGDTGTAAKARVNGVDGMVFDDAGNLLFADAGNHRIRQITPAGIITTVAGNSPPVLVDNGPAKYAYLYGPCCLVFDSARNLYFSENVPGNSVRRISTFGTISTFAGNGSLGYSGDGGPPLSATLMYPKGIAVDRFGNVFIADHANNAIRVARPVTLTGHYPSVVGELGNSHARNFYSRFDRHRTGGRLQSGRLTQQSGKTREGG